LFTRPSIVEVNPNVASQTMVVPSESAVAPSAPYCRIMARAGPEEVHSIHLQHVPEAEAREGAKIDPALLSQKRGDTDRPVLTPILVGCGLWACPKSTADSTLFDPASVNRDGPLCRHDQRLGALSSHGDSRLQVQGGRHQDQRGVCHGPQRRGRRGLRGLPRPAGSLDRWLDPKDQAQEQVIEIPAVPRRLETLIP
jgi:hypothetical protein